MITLTSFEFWYYSIFFFVTVFLAFFVPGDLFLRIHVSRFQRFVIAITVGMVLWGWQGFIFGYLKLGFLTYVYLFFCLCMWIFMQKKKLFNFFRTSFLHIPKIHMDYVVLIIIILGIVVQLAPVGGFALRFDKGIFLCCGNREDLLFHLALTSSLTESMPPFEPGMSGVLVKNYHYWSNLVVSELVRVFHLPLFYTQFQYMPLFISLFWGFSSIVLGEFLMISRTFTRWLVFLAYFSADAIFFLLLALGKGLDRLKLVSSIDDGTVFLVNPPRAFSLVVAYVGISLFIVWIRRKSMFLGIVTMFVLVSSLGFKVYTGFFMLTGLSFLLIYFLYKRKYYNTIPVFIAYIFSAIVYFPTNSKAGGLFFNPFHLARDFIVQPAFELSRLELARQIYLEHKNYLHAFINDLIYFVIFIPAIFGIKVLALFQSIHSILRIHKELLILIFSGIAVSFFLGMFFLQQSGGANTFNFVVSSIVFLSIPTALALEYCQKNIPSRLRILFILIVILLVLPRIALNTFLNVTEYARLGYRFIPNEELKAYKFIQSNSRIDSLFLVDPDNDLDRGSPYISVFTQRKMFLSGDGILISHGHNIQERSLSKEIIFRSSNPYHVASELLKNRISHLILLQKETLNATESAYFTNIIFSNSSATVVMVDKINTIQFLCEKSIKNKDICLKYYNEL